MYLSIVRNYVNHIFRMMIIGVMLGILVLAGSSGCGRKFTSKGIDVAPWRSLLQGMDLQGWNTLGSGSWRVARQGMLVGEGEGEGWIFFDRTYMNFNLRFIYRLSDGASAAVAVRTSSGTEPVSKRGYEILLGKRIDGWSGAGSVMVMQLSRFRREEETDGIHSCQVSAYGDGISVYIDGRKKADIHDRKSLKGKIGFKIPTTGSIEIFDMELQKLPDTESLPPALEDSMDKEPGQFVSIMPGANLAGWKMLWQDDGRWYYEGDVIIGSDVKNNSWLFTKKNYKDYILRLEFKWTKGSNGGIIYRYPWLPDTGERPGGPQARAEETQIIFNDVEEPGAVHGKMTVNKGVSRPDEWNKYELYCYDDRIIVHINGTKVSDWHNAVAREGAVGIQSLGAGSTMKYRNIAIKEMPPNFKYPE